MSHSIKHILVIRLSAMGDVAMTVPVLKAFSQQYPSIKITILTRPFFAPLFRDIPQVNVFFAKVNQEHKGVLGLFRLMNSLKKLEFDAVADLHKVLRSCLVTFFLGVSKKSFIDKGRKDKKLLTSGKIFHQLKTTHQRYADVFEQLGFPLSLEHPIFPKSVVLSNTITAITGIKSKKWIGIAPFAQYQSKMYPWDLMKKVIETLSMRYKIFLLGGKGKEADFLNNYANSLDNVVNIAGQFTFNQELDIISQLDVMLSMDSGNAHIAAMMGVQVITLWGGTHPFAGFSAFNQSVDNAILADKNKFPLIPTSIYGNRNPDNYKEVMRSILPETVVEKVTLVVGRL